MKKTVTDIVLERLLKDVEESEKMPWQKPYSQYNSFNYFTMNTYRGINRLILPFGEYMTANQINEYNKAHNEDFKFQKGILWYPVVFFKHEEKSITLNQVLEAFEEYNPSNDDYFIGTKNGWSYYNTEQGYFKKRNILRYSNVAERKHFKNSKGELLPSRIETGEVQITLSEPKKVVEDYLKRENIKVEETLGVPCWNIITDVIEMNNHCNSEEAWFSVMFHEMAHSTGHKSRLNREGCVVHSGISEKERKEIYAKEECIAEMTTCLCCAECGIYSFETSNTREYENNVAYVQSWKQRIKDWGKEFLFLASKADNAFCRIMGFEE